MIENTDLLMIIVFINYSHDTIN